MVFPASGRRRELAFALESYWRSETTLAQLREVATFLTGRLMPVLRKQLTMAKQKWLELDKIRQLLLTLNLE